MADRNTESVPTEGANINPRTTKENLLHLYIYAHTHTHTHTHLGSTAFAVHLEKETNPFSETFFPFRTSYKAREKS